MHKRVLSKWLPDRDYLQYKGGVESSRFSQFVGFKANNPTYSLTKLSNWDTFVTFRFNLVTQTEFNMVYYHCWRSYKVTMDLLDIQEEIHLRISYFNVSCWEKFHKHPIIWLKGNSTVGKYSLLILILQHKLLWFLSCGALNACQYSNRICLLRDKARNIYSQL